MHITQISKDKSVYLHTSKSTSLRKTSAISEFFASVKPIRTVTFGKGQAFVKPYVTHSNTKSDGSIAQIWYRVEQLVAKHPAFTENAIRAQIFASKPRLSAKSKTGNTWIPGNGLAPAIRKCGRSILINEPMYAQWIDSGSCEIGSNK